MPGHDRETKDGKWFKKQIEELKKLHVRVGFQHGNESSGEPDPKTGKKPRPDIVDIAMWNELGTEHSPPRPFMRQSVDNHKDKISAMCKAQLQALARGETTAQEVLTGLGVMQKGLIQNEIREGGFVPNAPSTIWRKSKKALKTVKDADGNRVKTKGGKSIKRLVIVKRKDTPLIDTGRMRQSVNFVIKPKAGE